MIKLKDGFMWRNYCAFYGNNVPAPTGLCTFFWIAVYGMFVRGGNYLIAASSKVSTKTWIITGIISAIIYSIIGSTMDVNTLAVLLLLEAIGMAVSLSLLTVAFRNVATDKPYGKEWTSALVAKTAGTIFAVGAIALFILIYPISNRPDKTPGQIEGCLGLMIIPFAISVVVCVMSLAALIVSGLFLSTENETINLTFQYIKGLLSKTCPLVEAPDSYLKNNEPEKINTMT